MKTFKFFGGFLPFKAIDGNKGKIIKYRKEQVSLDEFETSLQHLSDCQPTFIDYKGGWLLLSCFFKNFGEIRDTD